jgi:hypothetical protein
MAEDLTKFTFQPLKTGEFGLTKAGGTLLAEAAAFCLDHHSHLTPVVFAVKGGVSIFGILAWDPVTKQHKATYADVPEATEWGASGIAILVATRLAGVWFVQRSAKGSGVDYWLGNESDDVGLFQKKARLEVSGILVGTNSEMQRRPKRKLAQTAPSDSTSLPAYVAIVEFGAPQTLFVMKKTGVKQ